MVGNILIKRALAAVIYACAMLFAIYIAVTMLNRSIMISASGLVICVAGFCIPIAVATLIWVSSIQKSENRFVIMKASLIAILIFYAILLLYVLFYSSHRRFPGIRIEEYHRQNVNFIPLVTISRYIQAFFNHSMNKPIILENLVGNLFLFSPMGILLPCIFQKLRHFGKLLLVMSILLVGVETAQYLTYTGSCDIDDIILNLAGVVFFFALWSIQPFQHLLRKIYVLK